MFFKKPKFLLKKIVKSTPLFPTKTRMELDWGYILAWCQVQRACGVY